MSGSNMSEQDISGGLGELILPCTQLGASQIACILTWKSAVCTHIV